METPSSKPKFRWVLPFYLLVIVLGVATPFFVTSYKKRQVLDNEYAVLAVMEKYAAAQDAYFKEHHEYAKEFSALTSLDVVLPELDSKTASDYQGYRFRILTGQSASAQGGAKSYVDNNGRMTGGYGLLAAPAKYGYTGIYTFLMSGHEIYYSDFGVQRTELLTRSAAEFYIPPEAIKWRGIAPPAPSAK